jgi:hypothetical protein
MRSTFRLVAGAVLAGAWIATAPAAQAKTIRECDAEWSANKAALQAAGKTRQAFMAECRGRLLSGARPATVTTGKEQFATETAAQSACPADEVVWVNLRSKVYHPSTSPGYGKTSRGAYMCEKQGVAAGFRALRGKGG